MTPPGPIDYNLEFLAILGLSQPVTIEDVKQAYLDKAKTAHPDHGGDMRQFVRLQKAFEEATEYARFRAGRMQWLSEWVEQYAEQQKLIDELKSLGGAVDIKGSDTLTKSIGPDFATVLDRIVAIRLRGSRIDDALMLNLGSQRLLLAGLRRLALLDTSITSIGLRQLHQFVSLEEIDLSGTRASFSAVSSLVADLPRLKALALRGTGIGWWQRSKLRWAHRGLKVSS